MGDHMARNLGKSGQDLAVYDVRPEATEAVAESCGARAATSLTDVVSGAEVVFTSLPAPKDVESVVLSPGGIKDTLAPGSVYVDMSTNAPSVVRQLAASLAEKNITMLDAPVAGGVTGAEAGTLSIMVGGVVLFFERLKPVLGAMGTKLFHCGPSGNGCVVKLCNNIAAQSYAVITAEVLTLGVKAGVDLKTLATVIGASTGTTSRLTGSFRRRVFPRKWENPGFSAYLSHKDTLLALELAHELDIPMAVGEAGGRDMDEVMAHGGGPLDFDIVARIQEDRTGIVLELPEGDLPPPPPARA